MAHPLGEFPPIEQYNCNNPNAPPDPNAPLGPNAPVRTLRNILSRTRPQIIVDKPIDPRSSFWYYLNDVMETFFYRTAMQIYRLPAINITELVPGEPQELKMPEPEGSQFLFKARVTYVGVVGTGCYYPNDKNNKVLMADFKASILKGNCNIFPIGSDPQYPDKIKREQWLQVIGLCHTLEGGFVDGKRMEKPEILLEVMMYMKAMGPMMKKECEECINEVIEEDPAWDGTAGAAWPAGPAGPPGPPGPPVNFLAY